MLLKPEDVRTKLCTLEKEVAGEILERRHETHSAILALIGKKHMFMVGPPGIAKSKLVEQICKRINGLERDGYFRWLMSSYTVPEELYGGPDFQLLKNEGIFKRVTERKMPRASIVFLDEFFKGNSSILNTNLTIMNERLFFNHDDDERVPLISVFAASNELPEGKELDALWDRLHFRHVVRPLQESSSFIHIAKHGIPTIVEPVISLQEIVYANECIRNVEVTDEIFEALNMLKKTFQSAGLEGVTDRRWIESVSIIQSEAFMNGRESADIEDMRPLMHTLWYNTEHIIQVKKLVLELANPIDKKAADILDILCDLETQFDDCLRENAENKKLVSRVAIDVHEKVQRANGQLKELRKASLASGRKSEYIEEAEAKFLHLARSIMSNGFNISLNE